MRFSLHFLCSLICVMAVLALCSCNAGAPQHEFKEPKMDGLFLDYQAIGYEERGDVTVRVQFRLGGPEGNAVMIDTPAAVYFDGQLMDTGSTKMTGGYYEAVFAVPVEGPEIMHEIHYKDASGQSFRDSFYFPFFRLSKELPETVSRKSGLEISFAGLKAGDFLHTMLSDTSFYGRGIDRIDSVGGGPLNYSSRDLNDLKNGPVHIEFYREKERILRRGARLHGRIYLSYNISREFELGE